MSRHWIGSSASLEKTWIKTPLKLNYKKKKSKMAQYFCTKYV